MTQTRKNGADDDPLVLNRFICLFLERKLPFLETNPGLYLPARLFGLGGGGIKRS